MSVTLGESRRMRSRSRSETTAVDSSSTAAPKGAGLTGMADRLDTVGGQRHDHLDTWRRHRIIGRPDQQFAAVHDLRDERSESWTAAHTSSSVSIPNDDFGTNPGRGQHPVLGLVVVSGLMRGHHQHMAVDRRDP